MSGLHQRIKQARNIAQMTQKEIADHFDISRPAVTLWEKPPLDNGTRPDQAKLASLAKLTSVSLQWLMTGNGLPRDISGVKAEVLELIPDASPDTEKKLRDILEMLARAIEEGALRDEDIDIVKAVVGAARVRRQNRKDKK